jgi:hypothetical protein
MHLAAQQVGCNLDPRPEDGIIGAIQVGAGLLVTLQGVVIGDGQALEAMPARLLPKQFDRDPVAN